MLDFNGMKAFEILKNSRINGRRKRELSTLSKKLCIKEEYLSAIEKGEYNKIPERVYLLGFARNLAIEMGLDPKMITDKIKEELDETEKLEEPEIEEQVGDKKSFFAKNLITIIVVFITIIVVIMTILFFNKTSDSVKQENNEEVITVNDNYNEPAFNVPVREKLELKNKNDALIILQAVNDSGSWVQITDASNNIIFSKVLVKGDVLYVPNKPNLKAIFGNVEGIDVWIDNKAYKLGDTNARKANIPLTVPSLIEMAINK